MVVGPEAGTQVEGQGGSRKQASGRTIGEDGERQRIDLSIDTFALALSVVRPRTLTLSQPLTRGQSSPIQTGPAVSRAEGKDPP